MDETGKSPTTAVRAWREDGRLYLWGGAVAAAVSILLVPLFGLVAIYCAYRIRDDWRLPAAVIASVGGIGLLFWVAYLATL